jgi:glutamyl-tRNA reductase
MFLEERNSLPFFWCIGINYQNTSTEIRSRFAVNNEVYAQLLQAAPDYGVSSLFIISTCNRTEIYGIARDPVLLTGLLCKYTEGDVKQFKEYAYTKNSTLAVQHLFNVASGIDSQILGDYEIVGQLKSAFHFAKDRNMICGFIDRLFSTVLQSSRAIRSKTNLSSGTVSVAYAAVQFLKEHCPMLSEQKVLVIGTGDIGKNTCKNLLQEVGCRHLSVINRTEEKAAIFALELGINKLPFTSLQQAIAQHEIIIVATNATEPIIKEKDIPEGSYKAIIDLSIPNNVDAALGKRATITLANVDDLSKINDATLQRRLEEVPTAKAIINYYVHEFAEWYLMRQNVPVLKAAKEKIQELNEQLNASITQPDFSQNIQKVLNNMAVKLKEEKRPGCSYIQAINDYVQLAPISYHSNDQDELV